MTNSTMALVANLVLVLSGTACASASEPSAGAEHGADPRLTLQTDTEDAASGVLAQGGTAIVFEIQHEARAVRTVVRRTDGYVILDSELVDGVDRATLLGGRLTLSGEIGAAPLHSGDDTVLAELATLPERPLIASLREVLQARGAKMFAATTDLHPAWVGRPPGSGFVSLPYWPSGVAFATWSFWVTTTFQFRTWAEVDQYGCIYDGQSHCFRIAAAQGGPSYTVAHGQWWGLDDVFLYDGSTVTDPSAGHVAAESY